jgi:hypothetical protein
MTPKADFTDEEWTRLKRAPFVAGMAISLADPGGPVELLKETSATLKTELAAAEHGDHGDLAGEVAREGADDARQHKNPFGGFKPTKGATAGVEILDELRAVNRIVTAKASPEDAAGVRAWLLDAAQAAANAAKEGGFMGFHAERVSEGEQRMLDRLGEVLAPPEA